MSNNQNHNLEDDYYTKMLQGKKSPTDKVDEQKILSVSEALRMNSGEIYVQGMIISRTPIYKMISCYTERCINNECGYIKEHQFKQPKYSI